MNFTDSKTNISWKTDSDWYPDRFTCQDIVRPVKNDTGYNKARFFNSRFGNKWCYNLTTVKNQDYLIRGTFRYGDLQGIPPGSFFNVLIGVTPIGTVNSVYETEVEAIFRATNDYINFCLEKGKGYPYISKLELRTLNNSDYFQLEPSGVLKLIDRFGVGSDGQKIRYATLFHKTTDSCYQCILQLNLLSAIRHENLVQLLGCCCENDQQILVYPFMSNGSLQDRLYGTPCPNLKLFNYIFFNAHYLSFTNFLTGEAAKRKTLDWPTRLSISLGAARGK